MALSRNFGQVSYKVEGVEDLERMLAELRADMRGKVIRQALGDASKPVIKMARTLAKPRDFSSSRRIAGTMRRAIRKFNSKRYKGAGGVIGVYITVKATRAQIKKRPVSGDPFYWRFVEGGHKIVPRKPQFAKFFTKRQLRRAGLTITQRRRAATRMVKPYPFLGPALPATGDEAVRAFAPAVQRRIAQANARKTATR